MLGRGYPFNSSLYALHRERREYVGFYLHLVKYSIQFQNLSKWKYLLYEITYNWKIRKERSFKKMQQIGKISFSEFKYFIA